MNDHLIKAIRKFTKLPRQHASYFNWYDKGVKESGIVNDFLDEKNHHNMHEFISFTVPETDPPDAWLYDKSHKKTALEITELVNRNAINAQIHNKSEYESECEKWAELSYFESELNERILKKQRKCSALFDQGFLVDLLLHSDELWLEFCYKEHLDNGVCICQNNFSGIWLLLSYSPQTQSCPLIKL